MNFLMGLFISYMAFWLDEVWTFHAIKDIALGLLSGMSFPLAALPHPWREVSSMLPFQFFAFVPASLMNGSMSTDVAPLYLLQALAWTLFMTLCVTAIWRAGLARYNAYGG